VGSEVVRNDSGTTEVPGTGVEPDLNRSGTALMLSDGDDAELGLVWANFEYVLVIRSPTL
jgi:hypothetical protein